VEYDCWRGWSRCPISTRLTQSLAFEPPVERDRADILLQPVFGQFDEGFDTTDFTTATHLLSRLS
jgi:hypothetical protein